MSVLLWDESYSVKVEKCDEEHQELFSLLNALDDAIKAGEGPQAIQPVLSALADYTKFHFSAEEALLAKTDYPALSAHRAQHREFVQRVQQFQKDLEAGREVPFMAVEELLKNWLTHHIRETDRQYSAHLNANGIC